MNEKTFLLGSPAVKSTLVAVNKPPARVIDAGLGNPLPALPPSARKFCADVTRLRCSGPDPTKSKTGYSGLVVTRLAPLSRDTMLNWSLGAPSTVSVIAMNGPSSARRAPFRIDAIPLALVTVLRSISISGNAPAATRVAPFRTDSLRRAPATSAPSVRGAGPLVSCAPFESVNNAPLPLIVLSTMEARLPARLAVVPARSTSTNALAPV